ncbi:Tetratricopeptide repeat protein 39 [Cordyceps fumosorosea ARSEF 2679]|uniref:Inclusion body clearance protein IML2 n=1 Tax=Cordyceps fumosorosea (strain ARSEF 2679) TaxID=1081104 RepID=A0A167LP40_CORFA|nr:Tetratricopeptide repeat protein 39 [Cordyceps fumosorosea ARSEF 2679]OAA53322.1 Tetratricopeptide repeat protein 39 [Cordyceps fumosorosea ARSEF 2679]
MSRLASWFGGSKAAETVEYQAEIDAERANLEYAMRATNLIIDDDIDTAKKVLAEGASSVYKDLGIALISFMKAILGFEKENIALAAKLLAECEARAWQDLKHAKGRPAASQIFPAGTEYEVVVAQTQLMLAVVGVLNESVIEAMSGCLKLRRAYNTLDAIMAKEKEYFKKQRTRTGSGSAAVASARASTEGKNVFSAAHTPSSSRTSLEGLTTDMEKLTALGTTSPALQEIDVELANPVDAFIHSGINMCMGMLMLMMSLMPPAFARILAVVGFKGDREIGMQMLWRSTAHHNANGAFAGITLLNFYHSILGLTDIQPHGADFDESAEPYGIPQKKVAGLLVTLRARFPQSRMWLIEEAKGLANRRNLAAAIEILESGTASKMKQIQAINVFTLALFSMSAHDWPRMRKYFLQVLEVNTWSQALYYYMAGVASLELYRDAVARGDATTAAAEKKKAEAYLRDSREKSAKKTFMARQLPFEAFVQRKLQKWEARSKDLGVDLADAVSVSPAVEMTFAFGTTTLMSTSEFDKAQDCLAWSRLTAPADKLDKLKDRDELGVRAVCLASILRGSNHLDEAQTLLQKEVLSHDKNLFKGGHREDYVVPATLHELAAIAWAECDQPPADLDASKLEAHQKAKVKECEEHLEKARLWESYVLDGRIGMRIQCGLATLAWYRKTKGWVAA